jgi:hypothetical protein
VLFDNKSLDMWDVQVANRPMGWSIVDGAMTNVPAPRGPAQTANNLVSKEISQLQGRGGIQTGHESNSGIYLRPLRAAVARGLRRHEDARDSQPHVDLRAHAAARQSQQA